MLGPRLIHLADAAAALRRRFARRPGAARGVLLVAAGGLGDAVLFALVLPRFRKLAEDGEPVTVLVRGDAAPMAFLLPPEVTVVAVDFRRLGRHLGYRLKVFRQLFDAHYRFAVSTDYLRHPDLDEALIGACAAAESAAMEPRPWRKHDARLRRNRALYGRLFDSGPERRDKVLRWCAFAAWLSGTEAPPPPVVRLPDSGLAAAAKTDAPTVLIQPFSAVRAKQCPAAFYARIIESLPADHRVVMTGAPVDLERNPEYRTLLDAPRVTFDGASFEDLVPALRAARLVVCADTALMHLGVAVGAPTLCLASAAYVGEIVPYAPEITPDNVEFLYQSMPCEGCLGVCIHRLEDGMFRCVARLDAGRAVARDAAMLRPGDR